jgi:hypothetical protein
MVAPAAQVISGVMRCGIIAVESGAGAVRRGQAGG